MRAPARARPADPARPAPRSRPRTTPVKQAFDPSPDPYLTPFGGKKKRLSNDPFGGATAPDPFATMGASAIPRTAGEGSELFERFTERARQVVVLAQDEARALKHNYIGTEHILLGLLREEEGLAARVLESLDITVEEVRAQVARIVGQGDEVTTGQIPFTPRATKVLQVAPPASCSTSTPTPRRSATRSSACSRGRVAGSRARAALRARSPRARSCWT